MLTRLELHSTSEVNPLLSKINNRKNTVGKNIGLQDKTQQMKVITERPKIWYTKVKFTHIQNAVKCQCEFLKEVQILLKI